MTIKTRELSYRYGPHSTAIETENIPATLHRIRAEDGIDFALDAPFIPSTALAGDSERDLDEPGSQTAAATIPSKMFGLKNNDRITVDPYADLHLAHFWFNLFGGERHATGLTTALLHDETQGSGTDAAAGNLGVNVANIAAGTAVLFPEGGNSGRWIAREIVNRSGQLLLLDRPFQAAPNNNHPVYPSATWVLDPRNNAIKHLFFTREAERTAAAVSGGAGVLHETDFREDIFGAMVESVTLQMPERGGQVAASWSIRGSHYERDNVPDNVGYSTPTTLGSPIMARNSPFYIGDLEFCLAGAQMQIGRNLTDRLCHGAPNGVDGQRYDDIEAAITGRIRLGDNSREMNAEQLRVYADNLPQWGDVALQLGDEPGGVAYGRMPGAQISLTLVDDDGELAFDMVASARRSPNHSSIDGALRLSFM